MFYPFHITEKALIMIVYGVAKYYFKYVQYAIKLLAKFYVMPIQ